MKKFTDSIHSHVKAICKPNPKLYPDPSIYHFTWNRNITNIYVFLLFLVFTMIFFFQPNFPLAYKLIILFRNVFQLICFVILCRSYLRIFNVILVLGSLIYTLISLEIVSEFVYVYVGEMFMMVACIMIMSGSVNLTLGAGAMHFIICLTKFGEKLAILVRNEEPEIFAKNFVENLASVFILSLLIVITLAKRLEKRSLEVAVAKSALEHVLEQQKTFILSFSHELRNPINSLLGNLQLVLQQSGCLPAKVKEMINPLSSKKKFL